MSDQQRPQLDDSRPPNGNAQDQRLADRIEVMHGRRERARRQSSGSLWRQVARVGTLGWMTVLPITAGAILGHLLDVRLGTGVRWALALIVVGTAAGAFAVWRAIQEGTGE